MDSILLDVIALVPDPRAGFTRALGPSPARDVGLARALEMERQRARCIRGLYRRHNSWYSRTVTKKVVDEIGN
jgi:hypothetical protein